jgi:hypothetical protein
MLDEFKEIFITMLPAAAGSALSVFDGKHQIPNKVYAIIEFLFGLCVAIYLGRALSEWLNIPLGSVKSLAISFTVGYIGLTVLRDFKTKIGGIVNNFIEKYTGK